MSEVNDIVWTEEAILESTYIMNVSIAKPRNLSGKLLINFIISILF